MTIELMPGAADDFDFIRKRMEEIQLERLNDECPHCDGAGNLKLSARVVSCPYHPLEF